jgi:excisionase family DNA binding protein
MARSNATLDTASEPIIVKPRTACVMLGCGITRLYELLAAGELESFRDGRNRKITVESIRRYVTRRLGSTPATATPRRRRGRPRKYDTGTAEAR